MVASGSHVNNECCFDYGNAETNSRDDGNGHMDAINFSTKCYFRPCSGSGPWVHADLENGLFAGANGSDRNNKGNSSAFVTAMVKSNGKTTYAIKGGNAQSGRLTTWYTGPLPRRRGYVPLHQEGAIVLGTGGDNSKTSIGSFFEGVMTSGYPPPRPTTMCRPTSCPFTTGNRRATVTDLAALWWHSRPASRCQNAPVPSGVPRPVGAS
jgi:hypothetical protein